MVECSCTAATSSSDSAKLVEQLNEASRELATLRATNAKLRAERSHRDDEHDRAHDEARAEEQHGRDERTKRWIFP